MANVLQDRLNEMVENIISKIENNETGSWFKSWAGCGIPTNFATKSSYNGFNILSLMFEAERNEYKSNYWLTFNQIKKLKAIVKKGEKSTAVFFFKPLKIQEEEEQENGEMKKKEKTVLLLKSYNVFNLDQTDIEIDTKSPEFRGEIEDFISNVGIEILNGSEAYYSPVFDHVVVPRAEDFNTTDNYYSVLFHELSHASGHKSRLDRDLTGKFGDESYAKEELIAELGSIFLCSHFNIESTIRHEAYLKSWLKAAKEDPKFLWKSASEASKILEYFIKLNKEEETEGAA